MVKQLFVATRSLYGDHVPLVHHHHYPRELLEVEGQRKGFWLPLTLVSLSSFNLPHHALHILVRVPRPPPAVLVEIVAQFPELHRQLQGVFLPIIKHCMECILRQEPETRVLSPFAPHGEVVQFLLPYPLCCFSVLCCSAFIVDHWGRKRVSIDLWGSQFWTFLYRLPAIAVNQDRVADRILRFNHSCITTTLLLTSYTHTCGPPDAKETRFLFFAIPSVLEDHPKQTTQRRESCICVAEWNDLC